MNVSRGLFRVWLVVTILWAIVTGLFLGKAFVAPESSIRWAALAYWLILASVPPALLFALGWVLLWVSRGFGGPRT